MVLQVARGRARLLATSFSSSNARRQGRAAARHAGRQAARLLPYSAKKVALMLGEEE